MSVGLLFNYPTNDLPEQDAGRLVPVSGEESFLTYWLPVIDAEGYAWLRGMHVGIDLDPNNLAEVLAELRQLQAAFPRYYTPNHEKSEYLTSRLNTLIAELETVNPDDLSPGKLELFLG